MRNPIKYLILIAAMCAVVATSNYLVQFPVNYSFAKFNLADILTWAALHLSGGVSNYRFIQPLLWPLWRT